jgi:ATP-binding cassette subfamily B protein
MAQRALRTLTAGLGSLEGAWLAWQQIAPLFRAAADAPKPGALAAPSRQNGEKVLEARDLTYRYDERSDPVLRGCSLTIHRGDWIMLEGASGDGKSTLAAMLSGLREPDSGLLLAGGCDRSTLGDVRWRRRVAYAPQSHENHIFAGSLAFNLLMGRAWPPTWEDLADAQGVCRELGLSELLTRMPAGIDQIVGETGWQLSEGERGRIFLGRALLSRANLLVLDESLAALDPESLLCAHQALRNRAQTVLMVAHP